MIDSTKTIVLVMFLAGASRASAQTCDQLRQEIKRLTQTQHNEENARNSCRNHLRPCTDADLRDLEDGIRAVAEEIAADVAALPTCAALPPPPRAHTPFTATDVSQDSDFRDATLGARYPDPSGRVLTVVVDPTTPANLYAASEFAGVWKSTNSATTWTQSSAGLTMSDLWAPGAGAGPVLAIDETNPRRLVLASGQSDYRPVNRSGGIWVSLDGAATWRHATVTRNLSCVPTTATRVAFAGGRGYALTDCGIASSSTGDLATWSLLTAPFATSAATYIAALGPRLFACDGATVHLGSWSAGRAPQLTWSTTTATLAGSCFGLAAAPSSGSPLVFAIHLMGTSRTSYEVSSAEFGRSGAVLNRLSFTPQSGSGVPGVFVAARRGDTAVPYDVFAADRLGFLQHVPAAAARPAAWVPLAPIHWDTWSMAFPATYDPRNGNCTAYAASDGGIHVSAAPTPGRSCQAATGTWTRADKGLHVFGSTSVVGVRNPYRTIGNRKVPCTSSHADCTVLYLSGADNGTWVSLTGGVPGTSWAPMYCCGDSGSATLDWAAPNVVVITRGGQRERYDGGTTPATSLSGAVDIGGVPPVSSKLPDLGEPPQQATFSQVITLTAETRANPLSDAISNGDYFQVMTTASDDTVMRMANASATTRAWKDIIPPAQHLGTGTITAIATAGGHQNPTVFAITTDGKLQRIKLADANPVWQDATGAATAAAAGPAGTTAGPVRLQSAGDVWVNPDNPLQVYVTDTGAGKIRHSIDGGVTWYDDDPLTRLAMHGSEFSFGCFGPPQNGRVFCSLQQMLFVRDRSQLRVAILFPGGVAITRDGGATWRAIEGFTTSGMHIQSLRDLIARPYAGYLDVAADETFSLYLALRGRGLVRIDGRF